MAKPRQKIDQFTLRRLGRFIDGFRQKTGQLPTLKDLAADGFDEALVDSAIKDGRLEQLYVTLTNGSVVKGFKIRR